MQPGVCMPDSHQVHRSTASNHRAAGCQCARGCPQELAFLILIMSIGPKPPTAERAGGRCSLELACVILITFIGPRLPTKEGQGADSANEHPRACMADSHRFTGPKPPTTEWQTDNAANDPEDAPRSSEI